jgi:peroxiredoxin
MIETMEDAVDREVLLSDGSTKQLSDFWKKKPLVLVFLRHFG